MNDLPIPDPSNILLPGPVWLFQALLLATFIIHLLGMNLVLGGSVISAVHLFRGRTRAHERDLALALIKILPVAMAMTITFGVPPLLFIQTLMGPLFYTSSILTAWPWLMILALLVLAYYGFYFLSMKGKDWQQWAPWIAFASAVMLFLVGAIFTSNLTLMQAPGRFNEAYNSPVLGLYLNFPDPTLMPRLLHFTLAALAVTGAFVALRHRGEVEKRNAGLAWLVGATLVQAAIGMWFLTSLPEQVFDALLGKTIFGLPVFWTSIASAVLMLLAFAGAVINRYARVLLPVGGFLLLATVGLMAGIRTIVRSAYLLPVYVQDDRVVSQWGPFAMFAITSVIGVIAIGWLIKVYRRSLPGA